MIKSILLASLIFISGTAAQACTLQEFNDALKKTTANMRKEMDTLGSMLGTLSQEDIDKLLTRQVSPEGLTTSDLLVNGSEYVYGGLGMFDEYSNTPTK